MNSIVIITLAAWAFIALPLVLLTFCYVEGCLIRYKEGTRTKKTSNKYTNKRR